MEKRQLAVVTGGSSGIGKSICLRMAKEGYKVINADIIAPLEKPPTNYNYLQCDVTKAGQVMELSHLIQQEGEPSLLVLNAARGIHERLRDGDPEKWIEVINLNVCGTLRVIRAVLPFMKRGHVVFISSVSSSKPHPYGGIYTSTKSALDSIAETLRQEELPDIGVTTISPGVVNTSFFDNMVAGGHSIESIGWNTIEPDEVANAVSFAVNQKKGTFINNITIRPADQHL